MTAEEQKQTNDDKKQPTKMNNLMDAASALTSLQDGESENGSRPASPAGAAKNSESEGAVKAKDSIKKEEADEKSMADKPEDDSGAISQADGKRYLPEHKKPDAAPTFPEKLMNMMKYAEKESEGFCIAWLEDGKSFVINDPDKFTRQVVPKFFKQTKFTSFTRKLYRWGFRQVNRGIGPDDPIIFGNEFFQRDRAELMANMRSTTAASTRKQQEMMIPNSYGGIKRGFEQSMDENSQKRMMFDQYFQGKQGGFMPNPGFYGGMPGAGEPLSLTNALYPGVAMGMGQNMINMGANNGNNKLGNGNCFQGNGAAGTMMNMNAYMPPQQTNQPLQGGMQQGNPQMQQQMQQGGQYGGQASTAEIVNAAISALRYAN